MYRERERENTLHIFKQNVGTTFIMPKSFDHKNIFPDTHRHFRPAVDLFKIVPKVCGCLGLNKINSKTNIGFAAYVCLISF